jgi:hypothetical protein
MYIHEQKKNSLFRGFIIILHEIEQKNWFISLRNRKNKNKCQNTQVLLFLSNEDKDTLSLQNI